MDGDESIRGVMAINNSCHWLFEKDVFEEDLEPLKEAVVAQGMQYKEWDILAWGVWPTREGDEAILSMFPEEACVIFHGSLQTARRLQQKARWIPGVYANLPNYECTHYYAYLAKYLLNSDYVMLPFGELNRRKDWLLRTVGNNGCVFVRPSSGFKIFTGKVVDERTWEKDVELLGLYDVDPHRVVVVAEPRNIRREWRLVVVDKTVVTASLYREDGERCLSADVSPEVLLYGQEIAAGDFQPDRAWTLDICEVSEGLRLLEIGSFSCAGLYACNSASVVDAVSRVALEEWIEVNAI